MGAFRASLPSCLFVLKTLMLVSSCHLPTSPAVEVSLTLTRQGVTSRLRLIVPQLTELWLNRLSFSTGQLASVLFPVQPHI